VVPAPLLVLEAERQPAVYRRGGSSLLGPPRSSQQRAAPAWDDTQKRLAVRRTPRAA
jgi:hypothetical protein